MRTAAATATYGLAHDTLHAPHATAAAAVRCSTYHLLLLWPLQPLLLHAAVAPAPAPPAAAVALLAPAPAAARRGGPCSPCCRGGPCPLAAAVAPAPPAAAVAVGPVGAHTPSVKLGGVVCKGPVFVDPTGLGANHPGRAPGYYGLFKGIGHTPPQWGTRLPLHTIHHMTMTDDCHVGRLLIPSPRHEPSARAHDDYDYLAG